MLKPYRKELVQSIRDAGQELIDRAEDMVPKDMEGVFGFDIAISFPSGDQIPLPEITWTNARYCANTVKRWRERRSMNMNERMLPGKLTNVKAYEEDGKWYLSLEWTDVHDTDGATYRAVIPKLKLPFGDRTPEIREEQLCAGYTNYYAEFPGDGYLWKLEKFRGDLKNGLGSKEKMNDVVYYTVREQKEITFDEAKKALESYYGCHVSIKPDEEDQKCCSDCKYYHTAICEEPCRSCVTYKSKFERVEE